MKIGRIGESAITTDRIGKLRAAVALCVAILGVALGTAAQAPIISLSPGDTINTVAGTGVKAFSGDGGAAISAALANPFSMAADAAGNVYVADRDNHRVRRIDTSGNITTVAGNGEQGFFGDGGLATSASLNTPTAVAVDTNGNIYIADSNNNRVRVVANGNINTFAGNGNAGYSGDGGAATSASLYTPRGVAVDANGVVYIADTNNHVVRKVTGGTISTIAGNAQQQGFYGDNGTASSAGLDTPTGVAVDATGKVYVADSNNHRVRLLSAATLSTFAGNGTAAYSGDGGSATSAAIAFPLGVSLDGMGNIFVADSNNHVIRRVGSTGTITTIAGEGEQGFFGDAGGPNAAVLDTPSGVLPLNGNVYIADLNNQRVRSTSATLLMFANQIVGTQSPVQTVTVTNSGNAALDTLVRRAVFAELCPRAERDMWSEFPGQRSGQHELHAGRGFRPGYRRVDQCELQRGQQRRRQPRFHHSDRHRLAGWHYPGARFIATSLECKFTGHFHCDNYAHHADDCANAHRQRCVHRWRDEFGNCQRERERRKFHHLDAHRRDAHHLRNLQRRHAVYGQHSEPDTESNRAAEYPTRFKPESIDAQRERHVHRHSQLVQRHSYRNRDIQRWLDSVDRRAALDGSGVAAFSTATLAAGTHPITAVYSGDANFTTVTSPIVSQRVEDYTIVVMPASASIKTGHSASFMVTTTPLGGFSSPITLQCTNLPLYASCEFEPAVITPNGTAITSKLVVKTEMFQAQVRPTSRKIS